MCPAVIFGRKTARSAPPPPGPASPSLEHVPGPVHRHPARDAPARHYSGQPAGTRIHPAHRAPGPDVQAPRTNFRPHGWTATLTPRPGPPTPPATVEIILEAAAPAPTSAA